MKSKTYIIAWDGAIENCTRMSNQFYGKIDHKFFNVSASPELNENWQRKRDVRYYTHFFNSVEEFLETDAEIFIFSAGDAKYFDYVGYTKYIEQIFSENPSLIAFAPNASNDAWSGMRSNIRPSTKYTNFYLTTCTNGIYFALSREMCVVLNDFYQWSSVDSKIIDSEKMSSGWGIDVVIAAYAIYNNKYCYRDRMVEINHPPSSNYNTLRAQEEALIVIRKFSDFLEQVLSYDSYRYLQIVEKIGQLFQEPRSLTVEDFYENPKEVENA
jgi:hypothetical protein